MKATQYFLFLFAAGSAVQGTENSDNYRFLGRVNPATKELTWPSTGVAFSFRGTQASIQINTVTGSSSVDLYIDGGDPIFIANVTGTSITTPRLTRGRHTVELRKRSETYFGTFRITNVTADGSVSLSHAPRRKIEIIGDSISVGYGLDGVFPCVNTADVEDNPKTYGALAANAVGADYSVVAWSGKGLYRNYASNPPDTSPTMPVLYTRYGGNDPDNSFTFPDTWIPNAVVINLGTNDFSYLGVRDPVNTGNLTTALVDLITKVNGHYPRARFFLVSSPLLSDTYPTAADAQRSTQLKVYQAAAAQLPKLKTRIVEWPQQGADVGCDYHPNAATNEIGAGLLENALKAELGW